MGSRETAVDHIGIAVRNLDAAMDTYGRALGFRVVGRETLTARGLEVAFVDAGTSRLELIAPLRDDSEVSGFLHKRGEGVHHLCVAVENLGAALARMKAAGVRLIDEAPRPGAGGSLVAFVHPSSCHGVLLELVERSE